MISLPQFNFSFRRNLQIHIIFENDRPTTNDESLVAMMSLRTFLRTILIYCSDLSFKNAILYSRRKSVDFSINNYR